MKKFITTALFLAGVLVMVGQVQADPMASRTKTTTETEEIKSMCPKSMVTDQNQCFSCHTRPSFGLKESSPFEGYDLPYGAELLKIGEETVGYHLCNSVSPEPMRDALEYFGRHEEIKRVIVEVHNPGGSVFDAWRCVSLLHSWQDRFEIETHLRGMAFSAGFVIFNAGETRLVAPTAQGMWHELMGFAFFQVKTPASLKDEAKEYETIQKNINSWLASRSKVSEEEIKNRIYKKNWWMNGAEMLELGFADGEL